MKIGVSVSLDVTKIDKARLTEVKKKDGSTAVYLNMTTFIDLSLIHISEPTRPY